MSLKRPVLKAIKLGQIPFKEGLVLQKNTVNKIKETGSDGVVLFLQHKPVYTIGIRSKSYDDPFREKLLKTGAEFYATDRGGLITFHGPGQLIVYPILNLKSFGLTMKRYIEALEESVINMCKLHFNIDAGRSPHTGVWIGENKLCAIGVHGSRYITSHGLAINCDTDLEWFTHITPCGIPDKGVTSLTKELSQIVTVEQTLPYYVDAFQRIMKCSVM